MEFASNPMDQDSKKEHLQKEKSKEKVSKASIKRNGNWGDTSKIQVEGNSLMKDDGGSTSWSAVVMQALQTRDEMKILEKKDKEIATSDERYCSFLSKLLNIARTWRLSLIEKLLGRPIDSDYLARVLSYNQNLNRDLDVIPSMDGHITFCFSNEEDMYNVFTRVGGLLSDVALALEKWRKNFKPNQDIVSKVSDGSVYPDFQMKIGREIW